MKNLGNADGAKIYIFFVLILVSMVLAPALVYSQVVDRPIYWSAPMGVQAGVSFEYVLDLGEDSSTEKMTKGIPPTIQSNVQAEFQNLVVSNPSFDGSETVEIIIDNYGSGRVFTRGQVGFDTIPSQLEGAYRMALQWSDDRKQFESVQPKLEILRNGLVEEGRLIVHAFPISRRSDGSASRLWHLIYNQKIHVVINDSITTHDLSLYENAKARPRASTCTEALAGALAL